jgi:hypothetical protein
VFYIICREEVVKGEEKLVVFGSGRERLYTRERAKALARKITCELLTHPPHEAEVTERWLMQHMK